MSKSRTPPTPNADLASAIDGVAEGLQFLSHVESIAEHLGSLASAVGALADATAASVIAQHGTATDRERVVEQLKLWH